MHSEVFFTAIDVPTSNIGFQLSEPSPQFETEQIFGLLEVLQARFEVLDDVGDHSTFLISELEQVDALAAKTDLDPA